MLGSATLDVVIGLGLIYFLLAVLVSALNEFLSAAFSTRARALEVGIRELLSDANPAGGVPAAHQYLADFYKHPLIQALHTPRWFQTANLKKPSYVPAHLFRAALEDILVPADPAAGPKSLQSLRAGIGSMNDSELKTALLALVTQAGTDLEGARKAIETWFDDSMDRVSGWYKRQVQWIILGIALGVSIALNVDTFALTNRLANNPEVRAFLVAQAEQVARQTPAPGASGAPSFTAVREALGQVQDLQIPLGWPRGLVELSEPWGKGQYGQLVQKAIGILVTTVAVSLGAPFWFDLVNKLLSVRSTGNPPAKSSEEAS